MHTNSDEKVFYMKKSSTREVTSKFNRGNPVKHFQNPQKPNRKKDTGLLRSGEAKKLKNFKLWSNCGQTMVKLIILEY